MSINGPKVGISCSFDLHSLIKPAYVVYILAASYLAFITLTTIKKEPLQHDLLHRYVKRSPISELDHSVSAYLPAICIQPSFSEKK